MLFRSAEGTYKTGDTLDFTVHFSEAVTVITTGGTPRLALTIGSTPKYATYVSGSGSTALLFRYTLESGLADNDGITVANTLDANGGTLRDVAGNDAALTLNPPSAAAVLVESVPPTVSSVTTPTNGTYKAEIGRASCREIVYIRGVGV